MPWVKLSDDDSFCAEYRTPIFGDHVLNEYENAKIWRKYWGQFREFLIKTQGECGKQKDFDTARYYREEASYAMKQYRGWDAAIKWIEGDVSMTWPATKNVSEEIAPYVDRAFAYLDYGIVPSEYRETK